MLLFLYSYPSALCYCTIEIQVTTLQRLDAFLEPVPALLHVHDPFHVGLGGVHVVLVQTGEKVRTAALQALFILPNRRQHLGQKVFWGRARLLGVHTVRACVASKSFRHYFWVNDKMERQYSYSLHLILHTISKTKAYIYLKKLEEENSENCIFLALLAENFRSTPRSLLRDDLRDSLLVDVVNERSHSLVVLRVWERTRLTPHIHLRNVHAARAHTGKTLRDRIDNHLLDLSLFHFGHGCGQKF